MTCAETFRRNGITLDGLGLGELMMRFNAIVAINIAIVYKWPTTSLAASAVSFVKDKTGCRSIPHFALAYLFIIWFHLNLGYVLSITNTRKGGYNNSEPRTIVSDSAILRRVKASADNTMENMVVYLVALVVMMNSWNDLTEERQADIERWAVLFMIARTLYVGCYIGDLDILRTFIFGMGSFSTLAIIMVSV